MTTEALAQLMIRLAGLIVWGVRNNKDYRDVVDSGTLEWQEVKGGLETD